MRSTILLIESDDRNRTTFARLLTSGGHDVIAASRLEDGLRSSGPSSPDLVILSWTGPSATDLDMQRLRKHEPTRKSQIIVTANGHASNQAVSVLASGADDFVRLPFDEAEFLARIDACLRRRLGRSPNDRLTAGPIVLDRKIHCLCVGEVNIDLAPTEFRLMTFFLENQGRVFSRDELLSGAWTKNIGAGRRTVDVHVRRLRQQLEPFGCDHMIQTVRSFGYRFSVGSSDGRQRSANRPAVERERRRDA